MSEQNSSHSNTVTFANRLGRSPSFKDLYKDGMTLVEEAANYLDGEGRSQARDLPRVAALTYATESMRLTTRLMQMASWLLLQRAIAEGEMSSQQAEEERRRMVLPTPFPVRSIEEMSEIPEMLKELILRAQAVFDRIAKLDSKMNTSNDEEIEAHNPVAVHLNALSAAFHKA